MKSNVVATRDSSPLTAGSAPESSAGLPPHQDLVQALGLKNLGAYLLNARWGQIQHA